MKYVELTKLVNGYEPTRVWVNPDAVIYLQERMVRRGIGRGEEVIEPKGTRVYFAENGAPIDGGFIDVQQTPDEVVSRLSGRTWQQPETWQQWEERRERIADAVYGVESRG